MDHEEACLGPENVRLQGSICVALAPVWEFCSKLCFQITDSVRSALRSESSSKQARALFKPANANTFTLILF